MFHVKTVEETFEIIKKEFTYLTFKSEEVFILDSVGRVLHKDIYSNENIPDFNRSTVDGYAVNASDTFGASESMPAQLKLVSEVKMGKKPEHQINKLQSCYIPTGGELPKGANAVVMVEYSENFDDGFIYLQKSVSPGNGLIYCGDDVKNGTLVLRQGTKIKEKHIAIMAALGLEYVLVRKKPVVGIISTGDELIEIREKPVGSQVRDINSFAIAALINKSGGEYKNFGITCDDFIELQNKANEAIKCCDIVMISGGSSVGTKDHTLKVIESTDESRIMVHGIAIKPGKPTIIGKVADKPIIGLPGHPGSAFFIFTIFMDKLIKQLLGEEGVELQKVTAFISHNYPSNHGREEFVAVKINGDEAVPLHGKSGLIRLMAESDGFIRIGKNCEGIVAGEKVLVEIW